MQIYLNVMDTLVNNFSRRWILCLLCTVLTTRNTGEHRKLHLGELSRHITHLKHLPATSVHRVCYELLPSASWVTSFHQISDHSPTTHSNSQAATFLTPISTRKHQVFFKARCHIHCSNFAFLDYLTFAELCYHFY